MTASSHASPPLLQSYPRSHAAGHHERVSAASNCPTAPCAGFPQVAPGNDRSSPARLRASYPLQHVLNRAHGERKLLRVARAQDHVGIGPVLRIEEWIAADRDFGIGLGDIAELGADV